MAGEEVLVGVHSECLTGDALGSLRCECGVRLRLALRAIATAGRGVLVYVTGHEGRGVGLVDKLRSYVERDRGAARVDAGPALGVPVPVDGRHYGPSAAVLAALGVRSVRLLSDNPAKVEGLRAAGTCVASVEPLAVAAHAGDVGYLGTRERRRGHIGPVGEASGVVVDGEPALDVSELMGGGRPPGRPYVVLKFAQTLDGRIATATGDARWISSEAERRVSHALRGACDGVLVGVGTVVQDDPQLTVRMVPGASPLRFVLDSTLRLPLDAKILGPEAVTTILTTDRAHAQRRRALTQRRVGVELVPAGPQGVDLPAALAALRRGGVETLLVEGGARVITSLLAAALVDRLIVSVAPTIIGQGTDAVGPLGITSVADGLRLANRSTHLIGDDIVIAGDLHPAP